MAEKKVVEVEIKDNIDATVNNLKKLKKQLKETAAGSADFNRLSQEIRDMDDAIKDASSSSDDFAGFLENASGPVGLLGGAIRGAEKTFSSFNGALKASIIGLIVGLVGGLVKAFQDNEQATKKFQPVLQKLEQIFQGVFKVVEPLFDVLIDLAINALPIVSKAFSVVYSSVTAVFQSLGALGSAVKKLMTGDFSGAFEDAKKSVTGFSKNYDDANKRFESGTKELTKTQKEELAKRLEAEKLALEKSQAKRDEAEKIKIAKAAEEKKLRLQKLEEEYQETQRIAREQGENARQQLESAEKLQKDIRKNNANALLTENQLKVQAENEAFNTKIEILKSQNLSTKDAEVEHKRNLANLDTEYYAGESDRAIKQTAIDKEQSDKRISDAKAERDAKIEIQLSQVQAAQQIGGLLQQLAGKNKTIAKAGILIESAASIASIIMNVNKGIFKEVGSKGFVGFATAAPILIGGLAAVASTISAAKKGLQALGGGSVDGGGTIQISNAGGGSSAPQSTAPQFNVVGANGISQVAQSLAGNKEPVKAYVVGKDITTQQALDRNIVKFASLG